MNNVMKGVGAFILAAAFASTSPGLLQAQEAEQASPEAVTTEVNRTAELLVENYGWSDVHLYVMRGTQRRSLGFLTAMGNGRFELPAFAEMAGESVHIVVDPVGGSPYVTPAIIVNGGETFGLFIQNSLHLSTVFTLPSA